MSPSPCLAPESTALANLTTRMSLKKQIKDGGLSTRNDHMSRTIVNLTDPTPQPDADLTIASKNINDQSAMDHYQGIAAAGTTNRQPFNVDAIDKPMILPSIAHF